VTAERVAKVLPAGAPYFDIIASPPMDKVPGEVTRLLARLSAGDMTAEEELLPHVYLELHRIAMAKLRSERIDHSLQATALVHDAYMRLRKSEGEEWQDRIHFYRMASHLMTKILIDCARQHKAQKRGLGLKPLLLDEGLLVSNEQSRFITDLDDALQDLARIAPRLAQVVEMRFFVGMTENEIAAVLSVTERTVQRDWLKARAWLHQRLGRQA
jgi:RNA polymerase sigma-70 factor (ECF subfamily)